ncbi:MAG TPA: hypothetical protein VN697_04545 [Tepidiformaceae bacterium]|nr:hypothetical protein [Tepidiformaceae bacterium]
MTTNKELADGIRFAAGRVTAIAANTHDWDHQLGHQWTTRDAFSHIAASSGGAEQFVPMLDGPMLSSIGVEQIGQMNAGSIAQMNGKSNEEIIAAMREGLTASAAYAETLDNDDLQKTVTLGGYTWPKGELIAQIFIHHPIAHAYEASARWPIL